MNFLKHFWEHLVESNKASLEYEQIDVSEGRLSIGEVKLIAINVKEKEQWGLLEPLEIHLHKKIDTGKLIWFVDYLLEGTKTPYLGYSAAIHVDDETGEIVDKSFALR